MMNSPHTTSEKSDLGRIGRSTSTMFTFRLLSQGVTFITLVVLAQALGPHDYGQYSYILGFLVFFTLVVSFGINEIVIRDASASPAERLGFLSSGLFLKVVFTSLATIMAGAGFFIIDLPLELRGYALLSCLMLITSYSFHSFRTYLEIPFQIDYRMELPSAIFLVVRTLFLIFIIVGLHQGVTIGYAIITGLVSETAGLLLLIFLARRRDYLPRPSWDREKFTYIIKQSWPVAIAGTFIMVYTKIDILFLQWLRNSTEVGYYAVSMRLVDALAIVPTVFMTAALPLFSRSFREDVGLFFRRVRLSFRLLLAVILPIVGVIAFYSVEVIRLLYGEDYAPSAAALQILIFAEIFVYGGLVFDNSLVACGKQRFTGLLAALMALSNIILNLIFIPQYGIAGAAWATVVSYGLGLTIAVFIPTIRGQSLSFWREFFIPLAIAIGLGGIAKALHFPLAAACLLTAGGFYSALHFTGILRIAHVRQMVKIITNRQE
ncbi:hypothetical protein CEE37_11405 [candidate division LCP-89 bacterium B3_LCP]|uniref:Uncharacterized protein n=1 Tax=candidate division LCP-89 bacterium B3_LCP TaxID=2012998 RepID=A0A532UVR0_UNCL8|nr:MAG: hypothetical protein CEE37_11405 [candidate division LCP-89 bacterium B3_LCP]